MEDNKIIEVEDTVQVDSMITFKDIKKDDPESKAYLILIVGFDEDGDEFRDFDFITGRTEAYEYIKARVEAIDLMESKIVVETDKIENLKPVLRFMRYVLDNGLIEDPGFDIMDYVTGDYDYEKDE